MAVQGYMILMCYIVSASVCLKDYFTPKISTCESYTIFQVYRSYMIALCEKRTEVEVIYGQLSSAVLRPEHLVCEISLDRE